MRGFPRMGLFYCASDLITSERRSPRGKQNSHERGSRGERPPRRLLIVFAAFAKRVDDTDGGSHVVLTLDGEVGVEERRAHVICAETDGKEGRQSVLDAATCRPGNVIDESRQDLAARIEIDPGFARSAQEKLGINAERSSANGVEDRSSHVAQKIRVMAGVRYIGGSFVAEIEFYPKARMKVGREACVHAVHRQAIAGDRKSVEVRVADPGFHRGRDPSEERNLRVRPLNQNDKN